MYSSRFTFLTVTLLLYLDFCLATQQTLSFKDETTNLFVDILKSKNGTKECYEDSDCNHPNGICDSGTCVCSVFFGGDHCEEDWRDDKTWLAWFIVYSLWGAGLQLVCVVWASYQLWVTLKFYHDGGWEKWTLTTYINIIGLVAGAMRVFDFLVDPHDLWGIFGRIAEEFFFNIPIILWLAAGFMIFLYWVELQNSTGIKQLVMVSRFKSFLVIFIAICVILMLPITIWKTFFPGQLAFTIYNTSLALIFIFLVICFTASGLNLIRTIRATYHNAVSNSRMDKFLRQLLRYIISLDIFIVLSAIMLIIFVLAEAQTNKWIYVGMHTILRLNEFSIVFSTLVFVRKKKPAAKPTMETATNLSHISVNFTKSYEGTETHEEENEDSGSGEQNEQQLQIVRVYSANGEETQPTTN